MHVATAIALLIYFWREWTRIIGGFSLASALHLPFARDPAPAATIR